MRELIERLEDQLTEKSADAMARDKIKQDLAKRSKSKKFIDDALDYVMDDDLAYKRQFKKPKQADVEDSVTDFFKDEIKSGYEKHKMKASKEDVGLLISMLGREISMVVKQIMKKAKM